MEISINPLLLVGSGSGSNEKRNGSGSGGPKINGSDRILIPKYMLHYLRHWISGQISPVVQPCKYRAT